MDRAERRKRTFNVVRQRMSLSNIFDILIYKLTSRRTGALKKQNPLDCGNPKCIMCSNPRKIYKGKTCDELTRQEQKAALSAKEQLEEM